MRPLVVVVVRSVGGIVRMLLDQVEQLVVLELVDLQLCRTALAASRLRAVLLPAELAQALRLHVPELHLVDGPRLPVWALGVGVVGPAAALVARL